MIKPNNTHFQLLNYKGKIGYVLSKSLDGRCMNLHLFLEAYLV